MSKTNTEKMAPETQTPEMTNGMKLDVRVRPIAPMGNLLAFANVTIGGCFKIDGFRICSSEKGLYVNMPATQDKGGNWKDVCWPVTAEFRKQLNDALIDGYGKEKPTETEKPAEPEKPKKETGSVGTILFILAALLAVGGIGYYVKIVRPKQQAEDDAEFEDDGYGEGFDPDEAYGEPEYLSEDDFDDKDSK